MKLSSIAVLLSLSSFALQLQAQRPLVNQVPEGRNVRAGAVHDTKATPSKGSMTGFEVAYAQNMYPLDQMGVKYGHMSSGSVEHNYFVIYFEDRFALSEMLSIYGTSGLGYMLTDRDDAQNQEGLMGLLGLGLLLDLDGPWSVYAEANYYLSSDRFWVDGNDEAKRNLQFSLGVRWLF